MIVTDTTPPAAPSIETVTVHADNTITVSGMASSGSEVVITFPDGSQRVVTANAESGAFSVTSASPQPSGNVSVAARDGSGNTSPSKTSGVTADLTGPEVTLSGLPEVNGMQSFEITVSFSETVTDFVAGDISVTNGTIEVFSGSGVRYNATIRPDGQGDLSIAVAADVAHDAAGNANSAAQEIVRFATTDAAHAAIRSFVAERQRQVAAHQPDLTAFLTGTGGGYATAQVSRGIGQFDIATDPERPVWMRAAGSWSELDAISSDYFFGVIGMHRRISERALFGAMLQFDRISQENGSENVYGEGYLAGPYFVTQLGAQPLFLEGSLLYGKSWNEITLDESGTDDFTTDRRLAKLKVSGEIALDEARVSPFLSATHLREVQNPYLDGNGLTVVRTSYETTEVEYGFSLATPLPVRTGALDMSAQLSGIWSEESTITHRGRMKLGFGYALPSGSTIRFSVENDGLGSAYQSIGLLWATRRNSRRPARFPRGGNRFLYDDWSAPSTGRG